MFRNTLIYFVYVFAIAAAGMAHAGPVERYAGIWSIVKSEPAPWAKSADMIEAKEVRRLTGSTVEFKSDRIVGVEPLGCKGPHYELKQYGADDLFQGALAEYGDPSTSPDAMATKIGFTKRPIPSLVTGCAAEIEFHEFDADHLAFGLNNSIYRMTRQTAAKPKSP